VEASDDNGGIGGGGGSSGIGGFVPAAAAMLFTHTQGSPLHSAVTRLLFAALTSPEEVLWAGAYTRPPFGST
jgi:hypothetical protein